jgi:hypothetical protein
MPTERTKQRGLTPGGQDQASWPEVTAPLARKLPSAQRERKPVLAALALLLIAGGAMAAGFLVIQSGKRVAAIEVSQQVAVGQRIPVSALHEVQVSSDTGLNYVPWNEASQVTRFYAATTIPPGTLLTSAMVARGSNVTAGRDILGLALKDGQWPVQLQVGDHVAIYAVSSQGSANAGCQSTGGAAVASDAIVMYVSSQGGAVGSQGGTTDVSVAVTTATAGAVACNASAGNVAVVMLPAPAGKVAGPAASGAG